MTPTLGNLLGQIARRSRSHVPDNRPRVWQNIRFAYGLHYNTFRYYDPDVGRFVTLTCRHH